MFLSYMDVFHSLTPKVKKFFLSVRKTSASVSLTNPLIRDTIVHNLYIDLFPSILKDDTVDINS